VKIGFWCLALGLSGWFLVAFRNPVAACGGANLDGELLGAQGGIPMEEEKPGFGARGEQS